MTRIHSRMGCVGHGSFFIGCPYCEAEHAERQDAKAADALDAKDARIAELERALRQLANNKLSDENCSSVELAGRRVANIARAALEGK